MPTGERVHTCLQKRGKQAPMPVVTHTQQLTVDQSCAGTHGSDIVQASPGPQPHAFPANWQSTLMDAAVCVSGWNTCPVNGTELLQPACPPLDFPNFPVDYSCAKLRVGNAAGLW